MTISKIIGSRDLYAIQWASTSSPAGLLDREKRLFQLLASAIRMNPDGVIIKTTTRDLANVHEKINLGSCSPSTARRALAGLESQGYLVRRNCRLGDDAFGLKIVLNLDRWTYWTQKKSSNVTPLPTSSYIPLRQSMRPGAETTTHGVNSQDHIANRNNKHKGKKYNWNPIVFSILRVLTKSNAPDKWQIVNRAKFECEAISVGAHLSNPVGVPWELYQRQWRDMTKPVREQFVRTQILPVFRQEHTSSHNVVSRETMCSDVGQNEDIRAIIEQSIASVRIPKKSAETPLNYPEIDETDPVMRELIALRDKKKAGSY
jgi:hypothetical protein